MEGLEHRHAMDGYSLGFAFAGPTSSPFAQGLIADADGNMIVAGSFEGAKLIGTSPSGQVVESNGASDGFVAKFDSLGQLSWARTIGGLGSDAVSEVALDGAGNLLVAGTFEQSVDFDWGPGETVRTAADARDAFLAKYSTSGELMWVRTWDLQDVDQAPSGLVANASGVVTIALSFAGEADLDPTEGQALRTSAGDEDMAVVQLTSDGTLRYELAMGGEGHDAIHGLALDSFGNLLLTGRFSGTVDFDPEGGVVLLTSNGSSDGFVAKWTGTGQAIWTRQVSSSSSSSSEGGWDVTTDATRAVYVTGAFGGTASFDPNLDQIPRQSVGETDAFVWKLSSDGNSMWVNTLSGEASSEQRGQAIAVGTDGRVYVGRAGGSAGVSVLDSSGSLLDEAWFVGGTVRELEVDTVGNLLVSGTFQGSLDVDPTDAVRELTSDLPAAWFARVAQPIEGGGVTIQANLSSLKEGEAGGTYSIVLSTQPNSPVEVEITSDGELNVTPNQILFTTTNWNVPQLISVVAVDDQDIEGNHSGAIAHEVLSADRRFQGLEVDDLIVSLQDNDESILPRDATFGGTGTAVAPFAAPVLDVMAVGGVRLPSDDLAIVGTGELNSGLSRIAIAAFQANGNAKSDFDGDGRLLESLDASSVIAGGIGVQSGGRLIVAGATSDGQRMSVVRLNENGTRDLTFGAGDGTVDGLANVQPTGASRLFPVDVSVQSSTGSIVIPTRVYRPATNTYDFGLVRLLADGTVDSSFGANGAVVTDLGGTEDWAFASTLLPNGSTVVVGESQRHSVVVRYLPSGLLDTSFGNQGIVRFDFGGEVDSLQDVLIDQQNRIVVTGYAVTDGLRQFAVARLTANGQLDSSFGTGGRTVLPFDRFGEATESLAEAITELPDGRLVIGGTVLGDEDSQGTPSDWALVVLTTQGQLDGSVGDAGRLIVDLGNSDQLADLIQQDDGRVVVVGTEDGQLAMVRYLFEVSANPYDLNLDGTVDSRDIDRLYLAIRSGETNSRFNLNGDGTIDQSDVDVLVESVFNTDYGDVNLDGIFNSTDLIFVFQAGEYEDSLVGNSVWATGDWNGDGEFNSSDFVFVFQRGGYSAA